MKKLLAGIILIVPTTWAQASGRTIDFTQVLHARNGSVIVNGSSKDSPPLTLGDVALTALETDTAEEQRSPNPADKLRRVRLADQIFGNKAARLSDTDLGYTEERIEKLTPTLFLGPTLKAFDPNALEPK